MKSLIDKHGRKKVARVVFCVLTVLLLVEGAIIYAAYITVQYGDAILKLVKRSDTSLTLIDMEGRTLTAEFSSLDHEYEMNEFSFYCAITYLNQTISCSSDLFDVSVDIYTFSDGSELELTPGRTIVNGIPDYGADLSPLQEKEISLVYIIKDYYFIPKGIDLFILVAIAGILCLLLGVFSLFYPEKMWRWDHWLTVSGGEPTDFYISSTKICAVILIVVSFLLLIFAWLI